jgi:hypothetical protein
MFLFLLLAHVLFAAMIIDGSEHSDTVHQLPFKSITSDGMTVEWRVDGGMLHCQMTAPTQGWVAVGFNTKDQLMNTNLIMGCVEHGAVRVSDRFIVAPGVHKAIAELNGTEELSHVQGTEHSLEGRIHTTISFSMPLRAHDTHHHQILTQGQRYTLLMAYSVEDDFQHHSIMRTSVSITL